MAIPFGKRETAMKDTFLFELADGWALQFDDAQWIICRERKRHAQVVWHPVSFIGCTKSALLVGMRRKGINLTPEAQVKLDKMPERFRDWLQQHRGGNVNG